MSRTFEELATPEIDGLYHGALFLTAGDEDDAEGLLLDTLGRSFNQFRTPQDVEDIRRWLEGRLVATFMEAHSRDARVSRPVRPLERAPTNGPEIFAGLDAPGLHMAAGAVPWAARAALWLVLLRRWRYADASTVMGVDEEVLKDLLSYRHTLMGAILGGLGGKSEARRASGA
jgi:DNA-directed RNA polymerase specialized sigma24 family protein